MNVNKSNVGQTTSQNHASLIDDCNLHYQHQYRGKQGRNTIRTWARWTRPKTKFVHKPYPASSLLDGKGLKLRSKTKWDALHGADEEVSENDVYSSENGITDDLGEEPETDNMSGYDAEEEDKDDDYETYSEEVNGLDSGYETDYEDNRQYRRSPKLNR